MSKNSSIPAPAPVATPRCECSAVEGEHIPSCPAFPREAPDFDVIEACYLRDQDDGSFRRALLAAFRQGQRAHAAPPESSGEVALDLDDIGPLPSPPMRPLFCQSPGCDRIDGHPGDHFPVRNL